MIYIGMIMSPQATFWRRQLHQKLGGIDKKYMRCADYDFFCRMGLSNAQFYFIRDFLAIYRVHSQQLTKSVKLCRSEANEISKKYQDKNLNEKQVKQKRRNLLIKRAIYFLLQGDVWYAVRSVLIRSGILRSATNN